MSNQDTAAKGSHRDFQIFKKKINKLFKNIQFNWTKVRETSIKERWDNPWLKVRL